jgi:flagellar motor switch protein FliM
MEQILNLEEISMLREKARKQTSAVRSPADATPVATFDLRQAGHPSAVQIQGLETVHKICAKKISDVLSSLLRVGLEAEFASVEQLSCADFLEKVADPTYLLSLGASVDAGALMQIDLPLVFPILDLILGGTGKDTTELRELTEIEQEIFEPVSRGISQALQEGWQPLLKMDFQRGRWLQKTQATALLSPADKLLLVTFQVRLQETQGSLLLAFPSAISAALLRKLTPQDPSPQPVLPRERGRLQERLLDSRFEAELLLPRSKVSIRQLCGLQPGDVLVLQVRSNEPVEVHVAGREMFLASPVRCGPQRGAQVQKVLSIVPKREGEEKK